MGQESGDRAPGDFGIDPLKLNENPAKKAKFELQEVKNGRLAMWAAAGMIMQGVTTDGGAVDNLFVSACCIFVFYLLVLDEPSFLFKARLATQGKAGYTQVVCLPPKKVNRYVFCLGLGSLHALWTCIPSFAMVLWYLNASVCLFVARSIV